MSPSSLPSTWPRTFSVLGLGAASIFFVFLVADRSEGTTSSAVLVDTILGSDGRSPTLGLFFFLLASYASGQLALLGGSQTLGLGTRERLAQIDARIAFQNNSLLATSIKSKTETAELIFAGGFLLLMVAMGNGITDVLSGSWKQPAFQFSIALFSAILMRSFALDFVSNAENELKYFEALVMPSEKET